MTNRERAIEDVAKHFELSVMYITQALANGALRTPKDNFFIYAVTQRELVYDLRDALQRFMELPHLFDDVYDKGVDCKVCQAVSMATLALEKVK